MIGPYGGIGDGSGVAPGGIAWRHSNYLRVATSWSGNLTGYHAAGM